MQRLVKSVFRVFVSALIALLALSTLPTAAETPNGIVTITFDDGGRSQYQYGLRIAKAVGIPGTIFVPTALISASSSDDGENRDLNWDEIREFHDAGWEIGAHGRLHRRLTELDPAEIDVEVEGPISDIKQHIGVGPVSFSSPFGAFDDATIQRITGSYDFHLSWKGHGGRNPMGAIDPRYIGRFEVTNDMSSAQVCGEMVRAGQSGIWLVLLFHVIVDTDPQDYEITAWKFEEILSCASFLAQNDVIQVMTVRQAMAAIEAQD